MGKVTLLLLFVLLAFANAAPRFDCLPEPNGNQGACEARGCIWKEDDTGVSCSFLFLTSLETYINICNRTIYF